MFGSLSKEKDKTICVVCLKFFNFFAFLLTVFGSLVCHVRHRKIESYFFYC